VAGGSASTAHRWASAFPPFSLPSVVDNRARETAATAANTSSKLYKSSSTRRRLYDRKVLFHAMNLPAIALSG